MATKKISDLTELTSAADDDVLAIVDTSATETKKIQVSNLVTGGDAYFTQVAGFYINLTGTFYYLPVTGISLTEISSVQYYNQLIPTHNMRLEKVSLHYGRGATGRTVNLTAYDHSQSGQAANLGSSTNGPLAATSSSGGILHFDFDTSDFDFTNTSKMGLAINIGGNLSSSTTLLGCTITMRFRYT